MSKPVIGLTGGIASGKSTVARAFAARGVAVVDADQLARDVVAKGSEGLAEVVAAFGPEVLTEDGTLDRAKLGARVFSDAEARRELEAITHPRIAMLGMRRIAELQATAAPYVLYEAALLVETGRHTTFPGLVVVVVTPETQLARLVERDGSSEQAARDRIASQLPMERKVEVATWVIHNDGSQEELDREVEKVHRAILERFGLQGGES